MASVPDLRITEEEFRRRERSASFRSEFLDGRVYAMAGGTRNHSRLQARIIGVLEGRLVEPCAVFTSDMMVRCGTGLLTYPDVSIACSQPGPDPEVLTGPVVVFEVLSPSTEAYDRGGKFQHYRTINTLRDYLLVSQHSMLVEHLSRTGEETWSWQSYSSAGAVLALPAAGVSMTLDEIYRGILPGPSGPPSADPPETTEARP